MTEYKLSIFGKWEELMRIELPNSTISLMCCPDEEYAIGIKWEEGKGYQIMGDEYGQYEYGNEYGQDHPITLYTYKEAEYFVPVKWQKSHIRFFKSLIEYIEEFELDDIEDCYGITKEQFEIVKNNFENTVYIDFK